MISIDKLVTRIKEEAQNYYDGNQNISDAEFDQLVDQLRELDPNNSLLFSVGWGYDTSKNTNTKYPHLSSLNGLPKVKTTDTKLFLDDPKYIRSAKLDGGSVELQYKSGILMRALTRGDGINGVDCTNIVKYAQGVPNTLSLKYTGNIVGEFILSLNDAEGYVELGNQRNIPNGFLKRIDNPPSKDECNKFSVVSYRITYSSSHKFSTHTEILDFLDKLGFLVVSTVSGKNYEYSQAKETLKLINNKEYMLDGVVENSNNLVIDNGIITYPESKAYKTITDTADVEVTSVRWRFTRTGKYTPTLEFDSVYLSGASITHATAFNYEYVKSHKIDKGAIIQITRSGEVIPYVIDTIKPSTESSAPTRCEYCGELLEVRGKELVCPNNSCSGKSDYLVWSYISTVGKPNNMGGKLLQTMIQCFDFRSIDDIYNNELDYIELSKCDGIGSSKIDVVKECITQLRNTPHKLGLYLSGLNIKGLGYKSACKLVSQSSIRNYLGLSELSLDQTNDLYSVKGISNSAINELIKSWNLVNKVYKYMILSDDTPSIIDNSPTESNSPRLLICITGKLNSGTKSKFYSEYSNKIEESSVGSCDYLVCNEDKGSSKIKVARSKGIPIITEDKLLEMIK